MNIIKDAFNNIMRKQLPKREGVAGQDYLDRVAGLQIGQGSKVMRSDQSGLWLGASQFADAPFSVDMDGNLSANSATFTDGSDTTIIDASGIVSTANFVTDQAGSIDFTETSTTSTTLVDVPDCTISSFSISRSVGILVLFSGHFSTGVAAGGRGEVYIYVGGDVADVQEVRVRVPDTQLYPDMITLGTYNQRFLTASSPPTSYTIKAQWQVATGGQTIYAANRQISYMRFGV